MNRWILVVSLAALAAAPPAAALNSGTDVWLPAVARNGLWSTDMYILNPGSSAVQVTLSWLVRDQPNPSPAQVMYYVLLAGETLVLDDVILNDFGLVDGFGAFRVAATDEVVVNARIFSRDGSETFGQGSEGVPDWAATAAGQSTDIVGLTQGFGFRTNVYALAGPAGATLDFSLRDPNGVELASAALTLGVREPYLKRITRLFDSLANFPDGTLHVEVTAGSAVIGASKVDNATDDPTTLESSTGGLPLDGTYQISIYDQDFFAAGGNIVVVDGEVIAINGTYVNFDKVDGAGFPECATTFAWGFDLPGPVPLSEFLVANGGYTFQDTYRDPDTDEVVGRMTWTVTFSIAGNIDLEGVIDAVGSDFVNPEEAGCDGVFPQLILAGGKSN